MKQAYILTLAIIVMATGFGMANAGENTELITLGDFIRTADTDFKLRNQKELTLYLDGAPESTPYIDRMEFRTKTEEFDLEKQKYSLRLYPKGWGETSCTQRVAELVSASSRTEQERCYNDALKQRYQLALDYLETGALIRLKKKLFMVCEDRVQVLRKTSAGNVSFDISDLISAEELLTELRLELVGLENKRTGLIHQIRIAADSQARIAFDAASLAGISTIRKRIDALAGETALNNISLQDQKNKVDLANSKYKLEQAKTRDYLSFVQVSYDSDDYDEPDKAYSLEFAIKLPFVHSDRDEVNRRKVTYMKERLQYEEEKRLLSEKQLSLTRSLNRLIRQYALLAANKRDGNAETTFKAYLKMEGMDPLNLLKIKESMIQSDIQRVKTAYTIRYRYIELMDIMGKLSEKPFNNYLES